MKNKPIDNNTKNRISNLLELISENKKNRDAYIMLANELVSIGRIDKAIKYYHIVNTLREDYVSLYNLGSLYYKKGDFKKAIIVLEKAKLHKPDFLMSSLVTGLCYSRINNIQASVSNFLKVLMIEPSNRTALAALSIIYHNSGRITDSRQLIKLLSKKYPADEKVINIKSDILYYSGDQDSSLKEIKDLKQKSEKFRKYDEYVKSVPVDLYNDRFGTLNDKVAILESCDENCSDNFLKLSLVHLFSGNTDSAIDYLFKARGEKTVQATSAV